MTMQVSVEAGGAASFTTLSEYLASFLKREGLSFREASKRAQLPAATINALITRPGGYVRRSTRDGLVRLGLDAETVDVLTAQQAGWTAFPVTVDEVQLLKWYRSLDDDQRKRLRRRIVHGS